METIKTILKDERPIEWICEPWEDAVAWVTKEGHHKNCDEICAYGELGVYCMIPWFAVIKDGEIISRVPAVLVSIGYAPSEEE